MQCVYYIFRLQLQLETSKSNKTSKKLNDAENNIKCLQDILEEQRSELQERFMKDHSVVGELEQLLNDEIKKRAVLDQELLRESAEKESVKSFLKAERQKLVQTEQSEFLLKQKEMELSEQFEQERQAKMAAQKALEKVSKDLQNERDYFQELKARIGQNEQDLVREIEILRNANGKLNAEVEKNALNSDSASDEAKEINRKLKLFAEDLGDREKVLKGKENKLETLMAELEREEEMLRDRQRNQEIVERSIYKQKNEMEAMNFELQEKLKEKEKKRDEVSRPLFQFESFFSPPQ